MPALIVLQVISSSPGFSRNRLMLPSRVGLDQAVGARVVDRRQDDRRLRLALAVQPQHGRQIDLGQHVAVEDDDRFGERVPGVADGAAGAERHRLDDVADADAEPFAFAEDLLDAARLVIEAEDHLVDLRDLPAGDRSGNRGTADSGSGTIGFGVWTVNGRSRVPLPPASRMAFMTISNSMLLIESRQG